MKATNIANFMAIFIMILSTADLSRISKIHHGFWENIDLKNVSGNLNLEVHENFMNNIFNPINILKEEDLSTRNIYDDIFNL